MVQAQEQCPFPAAAEIAAQVPGDDQRTAILTICLDSVSEQPPVVGDLEGEVAMACLVPTVSDQVNDSWLAMNAHSVQFLL